MKVSYNWLCDFLDLKGGHRPPDEVALALARIGFSLEGREECGRTLCMTSRFMPTGRIV